MHSSHLLLEEPIRMALVPEPSKASFFSSNDEDRGNLGPKSRSVDVISSCLKAGMSVARFDFSCHDPEYHQETLENLKAAGSLRSFVRLCWIQWVLSCRLLIRSRKPSRFGKMVPLFCHQIKAKREASSELLLINFDGLAKVFLFQKAAPYKCNMAGKPVVVTGVVDSMTHNLRPTRAEAINVANAVLDGSDAILLGAETLRGLHPIETISTVAKICAEAEEVFNQDLYFKKTIQFVGEPMTHVESIASSAIDCEVQATMPVLSVVIPRFKTNQLKWRFSGAFEAESTSATNESVLNVAVDHRKASGVVKSLDRVVVCQKVGNASVVKIIELED